MTFDASLASPLVLLMVGPLPWWRALLHWRSESMRAWDTQMSQVVESQPDVARSLAAPGQCSLAMGSHWLSACWGPLRLMPHIGLAT